MRSRAPRFVVETARRREFVQRRLPFAREILPLVARAIASDYAIYNPETRRWKPFLPRCMRGASRIEMVHGGRGLRAPRTIISFVSDDNTPRASVSDDNTPRASVSDGNTPRASVSDGDDRAPEYTIISRDDGESWEQIWRGASDVCCTKGRVYCFEISERAINWVAIDVSARDSAPARHTFTRAVPIPEREAKMTSVCDISRARDGALWAYFYSIAPQYNRDWDISFSRLRVDFTPASAFVPAFEHLPDARVNTLRIATPRVSKERVWLAHASADRECAEICMLDLHARAEQWRALEFTDIGGDGGQKMRDIYSIIARDDMLYALGRDARGCTVVGAINTRTGAVEVSASRADINPRGTFVFAR